MGKSLQLRNFLGFDILYNDKKLYTSEGIAKIEIEISILDKNGIAYQKYGKQ